MEYPSQEEEQGLQQRSFSSTPQLSMPSPGKQETQIINDEQVSFLLLPAW